MTAHDVKMKTSSHSQLPRFGKPEVHDQRRREAERDRVDERVELFAEPAAGARRARDASVERVGDAAEDDERRRRGELAARSPRTIA